MILTFTNQVEVLRSYRNELRRYIDEDDVKTTKYSDDGFQICYNTGGISSTDLCLIFEFKFGLYCSIFFWKIDENSSLEFSISNMWNESGNKLRYTFKDPFRVKENTKIIFKQILLSL